MIHLNGKREMTPKHPEFGCGAPFIFRKDDGSRIAILLVDTQGTFDHDTTMALTMAIFGFSTLLSSYQINNVHRQIHEDDLQQLALFSEYARVVSEHGTSSSQATFAKPFQQIEFLVRDFVHDTEDKSDTEEINLEMKCYLEKAMANRQSSGLQNTPDQIKSSFNNITCFGLPYPGEKVPEPAYTGSVDVIRQVILTLLDAYCQRVFDVNSLVPKAIAGRTLTAPDFATYMEKYAKLFATGDAFPEAATLLEATTSVNNTYALTQANWEYFEYMDRFVGHKCCMSDMELHAKHEEALKLALEIFDQIANFGCTSAKQEAREKVGSRAAEYLETFSLKNAAHNQLNGPKKYVRNSPLPLFLGCRSSCFAGRFPC
jgi:atlastin